MCYIKRDEIADKINEQFKNIMELTLEGKKVEDYDIRNIIGKQKSQLNVSSKYYSGNIAEGNWSLIQDDKDIENLDSEKGKIEVNAWDVLFGEDTYDKDKKLRENSAEYEYVFKPSFYAVITMIYYYLNYKEDAERIYNLKTAVLRKKQKEPDKYYGGLPFILKYLKIILDKSSKDSIFLIFVKMMEKMIDSKYSMEINNIEDEFLNEIIDCISKSECRDLILIKRTKELEYNKDKFYKLEYKIDNYDILMHRDTKKDWKYLEKAYVKEAKEKILKTPKHPFNDSEKDSEKLKGDLKEWFSQRIGIKDRLIYKKDEKNKVVYIAAICSHYKNAKGRTKSTVAYR